MQEICEQQGVECPQKGNGGGRKGFGHHLEKLGLTAEEFKALRESGMTMQEMCEQQDVECVPNMGNCEGPKGDVNLPAHEGTN